MKVKCLWELFHCSSLISVLSTLTFCCIWQKRKVRTKLLQLSRGEQEYAFSFWLRWQAERRCLDQTGGRRPKICRHLQTGGTQLQVSRVLWGGNELLREAGEGLGWRQKEKLWGTEKSAYCLTAGNAENFNAAANTPASSKSRPLTLPNFEIKGTVLLICKGIIHAEMEREHRFKDS